MGNLQVGFAKVNINPPLGAAVAGYYIPRFGKGFLDDLEASATVLKSGDTHVAIINADLLGFDGEYSKALSADIFRKTGIPSDCVFLSATHNHTGSLLVPTDSFAADERVIAEYGAFVKGRILDAVQMALADCKPSKMGFAIVRAPERIAYIRRYKMKDGSTMTCPPVDDPNIDHPIGTLDTRVNVVRFDRDGGSSIVWVNYGLHADTVNGELFSADWPGHMRRTLEKALDGVECVFFNGAEGDVGSTNVHPSGGDMNDTEISFDNEMKSPGMARFVGRAMAGAVLQVYDKVEYTDVDAVSVLRQVIHVPSNMPTAEQLPLAHKYKALHDAGLDSEIPYSAMELTTVVAEAVRMCKLEHGPESFGVELMGIKIGGVALLGIPGEPFTDIGVGIKETLGYDVIMPCALTNGYMGYFPMQSAYDEGGYEVRTSRYAAGVAEKIIKGGKALLTELAQEKG